MNLKKLKQVTLDTIGYLSVSHLYYLGIVLGIHIALIVLAVYLSGSGSTSSFLDFSFGSSKVYLIVMGMIAGYHYFPMFVQFGVSRKTTFFGKLLGMAVAAGTLILLTILIAVLQAWVLPDNFIQVASFTDSLAYFNQYDNLILRWMLAIFTYWLTALLDLLIGWMVGAAFYQEKVLLKLGSLLIGIVFVAISMLWEIPVWTWVPQLIVLERLPARWLITLAAIVAGSFTIRQFTKKIRIKL